MSFLEPFHNDGARSHLSMIRNVHSLILSFVKLASVTTKYQVPKQAKAMLSGGAQTPMTAAVKS